MKPILGLDVDGVVCDFISGIIETAKELGYGGTFPPNWLATHSWMFSPDFHTVFNLIAHEPEWWRRLKPYADAEIPREYPYVYFVTQRPVEQDATRAWLNDHFPRVSFAIYNADDKVEALKKLGVEYFVEDRVENWDAINRAGITCFLMDRPWNREVLTASRLKSLRHLSRLIDELEEKKGMVLSA